MRGYPAEGTGYDLIFEQQLESRFPGSTAAYRVEPEEIYYLYRWGGTGSFHMSGFGALKIGQNVGHAQSAAFLRRRAARGEIPRGHVPLQPCWRADYLEMASSYIATLDAPPEPAEARKEVPPASG